MKKLLSIIGAIGITVSSASSVIACGSRKIKPVKQQPPKEPKRDIEQPKPDVEKSVSKLIPKSLNDLKRINFINNFEITNDELNIIKDKINNYEAIKNLKNKILIFFNDNKEELWNEIKNKNSIELKKFNKENFEINKLISLDLLHYDTTGNTYLVILLLLDFSNKQEITNQYYIDIYKII